MLWPCLHQRVKAIRKMFVFPSQVKHTMCTIWHVLSWQKHFQLNHFLMWFFPSALLLSVLVKFYCNLAENFWECWKIIYCNEKEMYIKKRYLVGVDYSLHTNLLDPLYVLLSSKYKFLVHYLRWHQVSQMGFISLSVFLSLILLCLCCNLSSLSSNIL